MSQTMYPRTNGQIIPVSKEDNDRVKLQMKQIIKALQRFGPDEKSILLKKMQQKHGGIFLGKNRKGIS